MSLSKIDSEVICYLSGENSLLDSRLTSLFLTESERGLMLDLVLLARPSAEHRNVRLKFVGVVEFGFYYRSDYGFYDVENVKFLMAEDGSFYLSIDPDMEQSGCSKSDQDFVKAMSVELILDEE